MITSLVHVLTIPIRSSRWRQPKGIEDKLLYSLSIPQSHHLWRGCTCSLSCFCSKVPLFKRLPKDQHPLLAAACVPTEFKPGTNIIKQGETGNEFFAAWLNSNPKGESCLAIKSSTPATAQEHPSLMKTQATPGMHRLNKMELIIETLLCQLS